MLTFSNVYYNDKVNDNWRQEWSEIDYYEYSIIIQFCHAINTAYLHSRMTVKHRQMLLGKPNL